MAIKTAKELAAMCRKIATEYKTLYVTGCFGSPLNEANKQRWMREYEANRKEPRKTNITKASADTFGFDCVNLIKAILWGWNGDVNASYGGAKYQSNGVPDIDEGAMFALCAEQSGDFSCMEVGEVVWMIGHIGVYIGDGLAVECTPAWGNRVQITACNCTKAGYNRRNWTSHGKLPYVQYEKKEKQMYRIRKSWENAASQIGAYTALENAVKACPAGYQVYDNAGKAVYPSREERDTLPVLGVGSKGKPVKAMQILLVGYGYTCGSYGADGDFGNGTLQALINFQKDFGLPANGVCDADTWSKLLGVE